MEEKELAAILTAILDLKVQNLALWRVLRKEGLAPAVGQAPEVAEVEKLAASCRQMIAAGHKPTPQEIQQILSALKGL